MKKNWLVTGLILIFLMGLTGGGWAQLNLFHLTDIRVENAGEKTKVIIVTDKPVERYYPFTLTEPPSIVVDLYETVSSLPAEKKMAKGGVITEIRGAQYEERTARVVMAVTELVPYQVSKLENKIVLEITNPYYKEEVKPRLTDIRFDEIKNEVIISTTKAVEYNHFKREDPPGVVVEFTGVEVDWKDKVIEVEKDGISRIRASRLQDKPVEKVWIVIDLKESLPYRVYSQANQTIIAVEGGAPPVVEEVTPVVPSEVAPEAPPTPPEKKAAPEEEIIPEWIKVEEEEVTPPKKEEAAVVKKVEVPLISMDFKEAEIGDVLRLISHKSGINIVAGKEVTDKVTLRLEAVTWRQALDMVTRAYGYTYVEEEGGIIRVGKALVKGEFITQVFSLNYADAKEISGSIKPLLTEAKGTEPAGQLTVVERTNSLVINDNPAVVEQAAALIKELDVRTPQVMIEAKIVEVTLRDATSLGIEWQADDPQSPGERTWGGGGLNMPGGTTTQLEKEEEEGVIAISGPGSITYNELGRGKGSFFRIGTIRGEFDINARLNALMEDSKADILSNPRILAINNKEARIIVGEEYPIEETTISEGTVQRTIEYKDLGIKLLVTPKINSDGYIVLEVHPEVSVFSGYAPNGNPIIATRESESEILVKDGETIVIGGLIQNEKKETVSKVPLLGDIPLVGLLFKNRNIDNSKTELLIFITTNIKRG
ncbi:MAG: type IV pilus secretin PilQ [bacterium]